MIPIDACEPFFEYMRKSVELDSQTMEIIASHLSERTFTQKHIILREGDICKKGYFIVSGTARSYYTDVSGMTITWSFHFNTNASISRNLFAADYRSFLTNKPAAVTIESLSEVSAIELTQEAVTYLMEKSFKYERWLRKLNEAAYLQMYDRAFTLLTMSATERYHKLLNEESHLLHMFSNYYIASYLGIAPQSLSRIRSQH
jgi:CRP-like cAMP-binding protein